LSAFWQTQNATLARSKKRCFKWSNGTENSIADFWLSQNKSCTKSETWCF
jgi:hypothetical protein